MSGDADKLSPTFPAKVVGRPTTFQRELERLVDDKNGPIRRRPSVRPGVIRVLRAPRRPDSELSPAMREKAEAAFARAKSMTPDQRLEFREDIKQNDPALFEAMLALHQENSQRFCEKFDANRARRMARMAQHEEALALTDQAMLNATEKAEQRLAEILGVPPAMYERVETLLAELQTLSPDQRRAYREDIEKSDPDLHAAVLAVLDEDFKELNANLRDSQTRRRVRMAQHEEALALTDQAMLNVTEAGERELERIKKAMGE